MPIDDRGPGDVPFVCTKSRGGTYDDRSFAAGFRLGLLDSHLGYSATRRLAVGPVAVIEDDLAQLDLIAMRHGYIIDPRHRCYCQLADGVKHVRLIPSASVPGLAP